MTGVERQTMNCVYCGECDSCSVRNVRQRHQSVLEISRNTVIRRSSIGRIVHGLFRATHPKENGVPVQLLIYTRVVSQDDWGRKLCMHLEDYAMRAFKSDDFQDIVCQKLRYRLKLLQVIPHTQKNCATTVPLLFLKYLWFLLTDFNNFSPLQSEMMSPYIWKKIYHLTLYVLPHYLTKTLQ